MSSTYARRTGRDGERAKHLRGEKRAANKRTRRVTLSEYEGDPRDFDLPLGGWRSLEQLDWEVQMGVE